MSVVYSTAAKNARLDAVAALIDAGASPGKLKIRDASNVVLATLILADPCAAAAASGILTFDFDPDISDTSADASGTAANAIITDSNDTTVISGLTVTVNGGGGDIQLDSVGITAGQTVTITTAAITHA